MHIPQLLMEKSLKIIIYLSLPIIIVTAIVVGLYSPYAYVKQCKQQATQLLDKMYKLEGGKEEFVRSYNDQKLSGSTQEELQKLNGVLKQCPELGPLSMDNLSFDNQLQNSLLESKGQV